MFSACFGPSVVSDTDFQIHIIIHCSTDWLFQRSIVPPREKCIIEDSWVMQAKEVHMFSQNCTIIRQKKLFYCLFMAFCSDCAFFRSVLSPVLIFVLSWRNKTRKKSEKKIIGAWCVTNRPDRCPSFVSGVCMHSVIENCNLFWILAVIYHKHSLCELCVCAFFLFFSLFRLSDSQKIVVRHRLWGNKREHRSLFNDIFFSVFFLISYAHFIVSDHHRGVFNNNTEKNCSSLFCSRQQTLTREGADHLVGATFIFPFFSCRFQFCRTKQTKYILYIIIHSTYAR